MVTKLTLAIAAAAGLAALAPQAQAFPPAGVPSTTNPGLLSGTGVDSKAIYVFSDAGDESELALTGFGGNPIFNNKVNLAGDTVDLGPLVGPQQFGLNDLSTLTSFLADVADGAGDYHVFYTTDYSDFDVGAIPADAAAAITAAGGSPVFIGWEDRTAAQGSDFDYNDLIFAFTNLAAPGVPEPASLTLLGLGLAGLGLVRRRK